MPSKSNLSGRDSIQTRTALADACSYVIVQDHTDDGARSGEGSIVELRDGRLLMGYTQFTQDGGDFDPANIATRVSSDGGLTWSDPTLHFKPPAGALNAMSVSLLRLQDGRIACVFLVKWSPRRLIPMWSVTEDEGALWSTPAPISAEEEYFCVNNDRLIQLADGTLVLPYARLNKAQDTSTPQWDYKWNMICGLFYSRDGGSTWQRSTHETTFTSDLFVPPLYASGTQKQGDLAYQLEHRKGVFQEPGVQELSDGSLMMHMRSSYCIYRAFAASVEAPWKDAGIFPGFNVCCSPQTIKRLPGSQDLIMLYNDRGTIPWGEKDFTQRTPLSVAISRDDGRTWERRGQLEDDSRNYCYASLLFFGERFIISYYQSVPYINPARPGRRNLASLKVCAGPTEIFSRAG